MAIFVLGLIIFLTIHSISIINHNWRNRIVKTIGIWSWQGIYSLVAIIGFVMMVYGYGLARIHPVVLYTPPNLLHYITVVLMIPVFPMLLATYLPGRIQTTLKHPMLAAIKLWAFAHLLANGTLADVLLFGAFLIWAVADRISLKHRPSDTVPVAVRSKLNDTLVIVIGLGLYAAFVLGLHKWLIGVPILK
jgi:uncharacterized membrane protein